MIPTYAYETLPVATSSRSERFAESIGTANPTPSALPVSLRIWALIPITRPCASKSGPPEFPWLIGASTWIASTRLYWEDENSLAVGVVSATQRSIESLTSRYNLVDAIQVDAPINHGNSGGPLFDAQGRVIGINAQIRSDSGNAEGVGFAVPINAARRSIAQLLATGKVAYAYVGITTEDLTPGIARRFGYPVRYGAVITSVRPGSPGARAGLRGGSQERDFNGVAFTYGGDVLVAIDGSPVRSANDVVRAVSERLRPGQVARLTIVRDGSGSRRTLRVVLGTRPGNPEAR